MSLAKRKANLKKLMAGADSDDHARRKLRSAKSGISNYLVKDNDTADTKKTKGQHKVGDDVNEDEAIAARAQVAKKRCNLTRFLYPNKSAMPSNLLKTEHDSDDFETPVKKIKRAPKLSQPVVETSQATGTSKSNSTTSNLRRRKRQQKITTAFLRDEEMFSEVAAQHSLAENFNPDEVQLALALSRSEVETNICKDRDDIPVVRLEVTEECSVSAGELMREKLKKFGFRTGNKENYSHWFGAALLKGQRRTKTKWANKFTALTLRDPNIQSKKLNAYIEAVISHQFKTEAPLHPPQSIEPYQLQSSTLSECAVDSITQTFRNIETLSTTQDLERFFVTELFPVTKLPAGHLLKDWTAIPGRDLSPKRECTRSIAQARRYKKFYKELEECFSNKESRVFPSEDVEITEYEKNTVEVEKQNPKEDPSINSEDSATNFELKSMSELIASTQMENREGLPSIKSEDSATNFELKSMLELMLGTEKEIKESGGLRSKDVEITEYKKSTVEVEKLKPKEDPLTNFERKSMLELIARTQKELEMKNTMHLEKPLSQTSVENIVTLELKPNSSNATCPNKQTQTQTSTRSTSPDLFADSDSDGIEIVEENQLSNITTYEVYSSDDVKTSSETGCKIDLLSVKANIVVDLTQDDEDCLKMSGDVGTKFITPRKQEISKRLDFSDILNETSHLVGSQCSNDFDDFKDVQIERSLGVASVVDRCPNASKHTREVQKEIGACSDLAGKTLNEIVLNSCLNASKNSENDQIEVDIDVESLNETVLKGCFNSSKGTEEVRKENVACSDVAVCPLNETVLYDDQIEVDIDMESLNETAFKRCSNASKDFEENRRKISACNGFDVSPLHDTSNQNIPVDSIVRFSRSFSFESSMYKRNESWKLKRDTGKEISFRNQSIASIDLTQSDEENIDICCVSKTSNADEDDDVCILLSDDEVNYSIMKANATTYLRSQEKSAELSDNSFGDDNSIHHEETLQTTEQHNFSVLDLIDMEHSFQVDKKNDQIYPKNTSFDLSGDIEPIDKEYLTTPSQDISCLSTPTKDVSANDMLKQERAEFGILESQSETFSQTSPHWMKTPSKLTTNTESPSPSGYHRQRCSTQKYSKKFQDFLFEVTKTPDMDVRKQSKTLSETSPHMMTTPQKIQPFAMANYDSQRQRYSRKSCSQKFQSFLFEATKTLPYQNDMDILPPDDDDFDEFDRLVYGTPPKRTQETPQHNVPAGFEQLLTAEISLEAQTVAATTSQPESQSALVLKTLTPEKASQIVTEEEVTINNHVYTVRATNSPKPDFTAQSDAELLKQLYTFGIKPLKRHQAVKILEYIYNETHPIINPTVPNEDEYKTSTDSKSKGVSCTPDTLNDDEKTGRDRVTAAVSNKLKKFNLQDCYGDTLLRFSAELCAEMGDDEDVYIFQTNITKKTQQPLLPLHIAWFNLVCSSTTLHESILMYEPIDLQEVYLFFKNLGYRYDPKDMKNFFDRRCIIFRYDLTPSEKQANRHIRNPNRNTKTTNRTQKMTNNNLNPSHSQNMLHKYLSL